MKDSDLAIRPQADRNTTAILGAILRASDYGVLLTDLNHRSIAANRRFGEIFGLDIREIVDLEASEVRSRVHHLIEDHEAWARNLANVYADPALVQQDDLELLTHPRTYVRRYTGPVADESGEIIGRLWTFLDISREHRTNRVRLLLQELSTTFSPDPSEVIQQIVNRVSQFFNGAVSLISIRKDDFLEFRASAGLPQHLESVPGNAMKDSYCQFVLSAQGPMFVQDARLDERYRSLLPAQLGYTRYAGAPIFLADGSVLGTLCVLDSESSVPFGDEEMQLLSQLSFRVGAEISRELNLAQRLSEQQAVVEFQKGRLQETEKVLEAMNHAVGLLSRDLGLSEFLVKVAGNICGLLGSHSVLLIRETEHHSFEGFQITGGGEAIPAKLHAESLPRVTRLPVEMAYGVSAQRLACDDEFTAVAILVGHSMPRALLGFSGIEFSDPDAHKKLHLEAIAEQVALLIESHCLQTELRQTHAELRSTQQSLVQSEKLSIAGTLAAGTAHDIKNILASLSIELSLGADHPEKALESVKENLDRFQVLSHRLLSYAKPRMVALESVRIEEILMRVIALTSAQLRVSHVQIALELNDDLHPIQADTHQLEHLFVNLVMNAIQAMEPDGGTLSIKAVPLGHWLQIDVSDSGHGIEPELLPKIFEPFNSSRREGFGLGLYSCKRIAQEHGGHLEVATSPSGTTFRVLLPTNDKKSETL